MSADLPGTIASWLADNRHSRPFYRDRNFIAKFGHPGRGVLRQTVDELKRRAGQKAAAIGQPDFAALMPLEIEGNRILFDGAPIMVPGVRHG